MPNIRITPWEGGNELIKLRGMFYPRTNTEIDTLKREGCDTVLAWEKRGNVPHTIVATSALTNATISDDPKHASVQSINAVYSTAFSQFVTGLTDVEQTAKTKKSMFDVGREIEMPAAYIDLRHRITHEGQVSLIELRRCTKLALMWLDEYYWKHLGHNAHSNVLDDEQEAELRAKLKSILKEFKRRRLGSGKWAPKRVGRDAKRFKPGCLKQVVESINGLCANKHQELCLLINVLLDEKFLIPPTKSIGSPMDEVIEMYKGLLRDLCYSQSKFPVMWLHEMRTRLCERSSDDTSLDGDLEAIFMWLKHVHTDSYWVNVRNRRVSLAESEVSACMACPTYWMLRLAMAIINDGQYLGLRSEWEPFLVLLMNGENRPHAHAKKEARKISGIYARDVEPWLPKPIGVAGASTETSTMMQDGKDETGKEIEKP